MSEDKYKAYDPETFVKGPRTLEWEENWGKEAFAALAWCLDNKEAIQALHSSQTYSKIFDRQCTCCQLIFKSCMFSKKQRQDYYGRGPMCRWCQANTNPNSFDIHLHVHCNRPGKKICGTCPMMTLGPPPGHYQKCFPVKKEASIADIPLPDVQFTTKKKMTQGQ